MIAASNTLILYLHTEGAVNTKTGAGNTARIKARMAAAPPLLLYLDCDRRYTLLRSSLLYLLQAVDLLGGVINAEYLFPFLLQREPSPYHGWRALVPAPVQTLLSSHATE